ncbi:MAG: radical SAM protein [Candidatus Aenigmarchaeota archaeon]|nr:radical SAM protein [Candidatus Aenigmarchaeota archaeon]
MPKEVTFEVTNYCNQKCMHCSTDAISSCESAVFMTEQKLYEFLRKYQDYENVRFSGGEPFKHKKLHIFLEMAKRENRKTTALSCGVVDNKPFEEEMFRKCAPYLDKIVLSMHGYYLDHDCIVTNKGKFDVLTSEPPYFDIMCDSLDVVTQHNIPFEFEAVVMKQNIDKLQEIASCVSTMSRITDYHKPKLHLLKLVHQGRARNLPKLTDEEISRVPKLARELSERYKIDVTYTKSFDGKNGCDCGSMKAAVVIVKEGDKYVWKEVGCSALKEYDGDEKSFPCLKSM